MVGDNPIGQPKIENISILPESSIGQHRLIRSPNNSKGLAKFSRTQPQPTLLTLLTLCCMYSLSHDSLSTLKWMPFLLFPPRAISSFELGLMAELPRRILPFSLQQNELLPLLPTGSRRWGRMNTWGGAAGLDRGSLPWELRSPVLLRQVWMALLTQQPWLCPAGKQPHKGWHCVLFRLPWGYEHGPSERNTPWVQAM